MFFSVFLGGKTGLDGWHRAVCRHAARLSLIPQFQVRPSIAGGVASMAWLASHACEVSAHMREAHHLILARPCGVLSDDERHGELWEDRSLSNWRAPNVGLLLNTAKGRITIAVPPATPQQVFWTRTPDGYVVADDLRLFTALSASEIDARGVYALFQYGTIPAPLSLFQSVQRASGGQLLTLQTCPARESTAPLAPDIQWRDPQAANYANRWLAGVLDAALAAVPRPAALYFSGGVDSALLAARLVRLGRRDLRLCNYSFGSEDQESVLAQQMAARLRLPFAQVTHDDGQVRDVLGRIGTDYSYPFGDLSTVPTNSLVHGSLQVMEPRATVVEGTGADGVFGLAARYPHWRRVYSIPRRVRKLLADPARRLSVWKYNSDLARLSVFVSKTTRLPLALAVIAQNDLDGTAYHMPARVHDEMIELMRAPVRMLAPEAHGEVELSLLDITMVCAGTMAPKSFDPLRTHANPPIYPYLNPVLAFGGASWPIVVKASNGVPKAVLKSLLESDFRPEQIYRPKSGFTPPYPQLFASPPVQDFMRGVALDPRNTLLDFCDVTWVKHAIDRARVRQLGPSTYDFLWTLAFASGWLAANGRGGTPLPATLSASS